MTTTLDLKVKRIKPFDTDKSTKAFADVAINDALLIRNLKVVEGKDGPFVSMPQEHSKKDNKWYDSVRCLTKEVREDITDLVLAAYKKEVK